MMKSKEKPIRKIRIRRIAIQILLNVLAIIVIFLILNTNFLIFPKDGMHTRDTNIKFGWVGMSTAKIDDNPQFTSAIEIEKSNPLVELKPGVYYWKAGLSRVRNFVIESEVSLEVKPAVIENETLYKIENRGNTRMLVNIIGLITGRVVLEPNAVTYEKNVSDIKEIEASQHD